MVDQGILEQSFMAFLVVCDLDVVVVDISIVVHGYLAIWNIKFIVLY